ncbi:putative small metal-binding protein [Motilibacter peucedani]|uniref:Putative small metal-binding protein n=1 Tax=Motilibacter peucedani TaxID=598650 RepID=A0A420XT80_9ACTN|nr:DUF1059 domain-containing protein [Motilibacter peucedani]RKS80033.1 putative small metal-binding protein [Motilibacter peucedani]
MKSFACGDVVPGCHRRFTADDQEGILWQVAAHAREDHGLEVVPQPVVDAVIAHIR